MTTKLVVRISQTDEALAEKHKELEQLQAELAKRELFLVSFKGELAAFEKRYLRVVGALYTELDEWNAKITELLAGRRASDDDSTQFEKFREYLADLLAQPDAAGEEWFANPRMSSEEFHSPVDNGASGEEFTPSSHLKSLFREVAKRVHPDLATDEADKQERQLLMAEANAAYQRGDLDALRRILEEYVATPVSDLEPGAILARTCRHVRQVRWRLAEIELEIRHLNESASAVLKAKVEAAALEGRDLLLEIAESVLQKISAAKYRYETLLSPWENG